MNLSSGRIVTILLVITTALFCGCTGSDEPAPPAQVQQTITPFSTSPGTVAMTPVSQTVTTFVTEATTNPVPVRIFHGDFNWAEYRENNTVTMPPNPRYQWEYSVKIERSAGYYKGSTATHEKITVVSDYSEWVDHILTNTEDGYVYIEDSYYDDSKKHLGGTYSETIKGVLQVHEEDTSTQDNPEGGPEGWLGFRPFDEMNISLTDLGTESVTVPAGTYPDAQKYTGKFRDGTPITFWVVPDIPVPVQYQFPNKYIDGVDPFQSYELKSWG
ncbi:MAG: hypothetical protein WC379_14945 [Methanoregula sp.]|jgi:hypothetical protein